MPTITKPGTATRVSVKASILSVPDSDETNANGEFEVILATPDEDREGEEAKADEWRLPLPDHITFDSDHGMTVRSLVGSGSPELTDDGNIRVKGTYASTPHAQETRQLVNEGHIRTVSVTFLSRKTTTKGTGGRDVVSVERELLNGSFVAVPANPNAVVLSSKSASDGADGGAPAGAANPNPAEMIQAIHNAAVHLGAECSTVADETAPAADESTETKSLTPAMVVGKAVHGSIEDLGSRVCSAVRGAYGAGEYPWIRATFLDDGGASGTVVYELNDGDTIARGFTDDGTTVSLAADTRPVSLVTTVQDAAPAAETATKGLDAAVNVLVRTGMTRDEATEFLGVKQNGATVAVSGTAAAQPAAATEKSVAAAETAAAVGLTARADELVSQLDAAAG